MSAMVWILRGLIVLGWAASLAYFYVTGRGDGSEGAFLGFALTLVAMVLFTACKYLGSRARVGWALIVLAACLVPPALLIGGFNGASLLGVLAAATGVSLLVAGGGWIGDAPESEPPSRLDVLDGRGWR